MGITDALCITCRKVFRWNPGTTPICPACVEVRDADLLKLVRIRMGNERDVKLAPLVQPTTLAEEIA